jgi:ABC-type multidrug transport system permease subunit
VDRLISKTPKAIAEGANILAAKPQSSSQRIEDNAFPPGLSDENIEECRNAASRRVFIMEVIAMFTAFIIVTVFTAAANTYAAIVDFRRPQWVLDNMTKWGGSHSWLFTLGALKAASALGLLVGIGVPLIGVAAAVGLVLFFVGAIAVVIGAHWYSHLPWPTTYLLLAIGSLALRLKVS